VADVEEPVGMLSGERMMEALKQAEQFLSP
jgi:hypothetical protein